MINHVVLVGKVYELSEDSSKLNLVLEVERPFSEEEGRKSDLFTCKLWSAIFKSIASSCKKGDLVAIKGRIINNNEKYQVVGENVVILNKTNNSIQKN